MLTIMIRIARKCLPCSPKTSVVDPDPESSAFFTPGSVMGKIWIWDPTIISESLKDNFGLKYVNSDANKRR